MTTWVEIDSFALTHNVRRAKEAAGESLKLFAVVKANGYGHGLEIAADAFWRGGVDGLVVTDAKDALTLAQKGYRIPVLLLNPAETSDLPALLKAGVRLAGVSLPYLEAIELTAARHQVKAKIHLELETGMNRFGLTPTEAKDLVPRFNQAQSSLQLEGVFTHFYNPRDVATVATQKRFLDTFLYDAQQAGLTVPLVHAYASGFYELPEEAIDEPYDALRVGMALYGGEREALTTEWALSWKTRIVALHKVAAGETISYGATYTADRPRLIGTLPVGYYDGVDRRLSNKGFVLVQGKRCPIVGRVCMNATMIDLSPVLRPQLGDEVVLLGRQGEAMISPRDRATELDTIDYEIVSRIPDRIPRVKIK